MIAQPVPPVSPPSPPPDDADLLAREAAEELADARSETAWYFSQERADYLIEREGWE